MSNECKRPTIGIYITRPRSWVESVFGSLLEACDELYAMGIDTITVSARGQVKSDGEREEKWSTEDIKALAKAAKVCNGSLIKRKITLRAMLWPDTKYLADLAWDAEEIFLAARGVGVVLDLEGSGSRWGGVSSEDATTLGHLLTAYSTTTHMGRVGSANTIAVMDRAHVVSCQAYSTRYKEDRGWGEIHGPGNMQREALEKLRIADGCDDDHLVALDLPLSGQDYPVHGIPGAMYEAAKGAEGADELHYFRLKHMYEDHDKASKTEYCTELRRTFRAIWGQR